MNKKCRIICFIDSLGSGGAQRQLVGLAVMLKQNGYDVKVVYYHDYPFYKEILDNNNVPNELIIGADNNFKRISYVKKFFVQETPDWVIAYQETPSLVATIVKLLGCNYKLIVSERNTTQKMSYREYVRFFFYRWADVIVPNSFAQEIVIKQTSPRLAHKIKVITNFIDLQRFGYSERQRREIPLILVVGRVSAQKNTIGLIKAAKILKDKGFNFTIKWYGITETYNPYAETCKQLLSDMDMNDIFELLPKTNDIEKKYKDCDYFCLPSLYEGTPNVIAEAMASGIPVACGDVCDNHRYVKDGINGTLFNPLDVSSIADGLQRLLGIKENYRIFCINSRKIAEEMFSSDSFIEKYESIIQNQ